MMAEICGYAFNLITFWYKCGKYGKRWRLISTDFEVYAVSKSLRKEDVNEIYFEHLDSYFKMDNGIIPYQETIEDNDKEQLTHENSFGDDFCNLEADLSDDELVSGHEKTKQSILGEIEPLSVGVKKKMAAVDGDSNCCDSSDTRSLHSDSETETYNYPQFNSKIDGDNPILALELTFGSKREFKDAVATHEIKKEEGKYIKWNKNDKERIRAKCIHKECKWKIMASKMQRDKSFQIKTYDPTHTCKEWHHENRIITPSFIVRKYLNEIGSNRNGSLADFRDRVSVDLKAKVTLSQVKRPKRKAISLLDGDIKDQFKMMWDYCNKMDRTNPGSTIRMKFTDNEVPGQPYRFQRMYICFAACKFGFKAGCRKIIGVDGCWLKGPLYETQLLFAVGIDGNNNIFPISHAIVERENKETWTWFLTYLASDLDIHEDEASWTFMSDKQKGFGSFSLKKALWVAAKATTTQQFIVCMNHMFELDPNVAAWCNEKEPSQWTMTYFSSDAKSDMLWNNVCEVYNSMILDARDEPILTLLEKLRYLLMARMLANREKVEQWNLGDVCPKIKDILRKNQKAAGEHIPRKSNQWNYEIIGASIMDNWAMDLEKRTCSCRKWSLTGIPCKHAIAAIWANREDTLDYVHDSYKVETY
ncbi:hypothetical protein KY284_011090 [Solanum tuberosum]|nr:hypothetical protein KY284_011090 [Solanum tuberosum]